MKVLAFLLLLTTAAFADTGILFNTFGSSRPYPSLAMTMHPDENNNLLMVGVANDPAGVRSVTISTTNSANGKTQVLATFSTATFMFVWARASMRGGSNPVTLQYTNNLGVTRQITGAVNQPVPLL